MELEREIIAEYPNLGSEFVNLVAKTDAIKALFIRVSDIANGNAVMPFLHAIFMLDAYQILFKDDYMIEQLKIVVGLSRVRQIRLIRKVNLRIQERHPNQLVLFEITQDMIDLMNGINELIERAQEFNVNPSKYLDESTDEDDINQSTNDFCMTYWDKKLSKDIRADMLNTGDFIRLVTDINGVVWVIVISRQNGPGKGHFAWAGGYVDKGETLEEASKREGDEEISEIKSGDNEYIEVETYECGLPSYDIKYWDIRYYNAIALSCGIIPKHGACLFHTTYKLVSAKNKKQKMN
jgi:hypothetical protein